MTARLAALVLALALATPALAQMVTGPDDRPVPTGVDNHIRDLGGPSRPPTLPPVLGGYDPTGKTPLPYDAPEVKELMGIMFENTQTCVIPGHMECHVWFYPDGRMVQFSYDDRKTGYAWDLTNDMAGFVVLPGTWSIIKDEKGLVLCRQLGNLPRPRCSLTKPQQLGGTWFFIHSENSTLKGLKETFTLLKGRQ